ncbi:deoxyribose-phosphate aldolase [Mycolicibacterium confluentis]|uniref:Deoxyribose-phosphate aldolase n=1 Tax=Mycolicibacterium confluentis TaxID=28047 RepID=A0A7I7Y1H6_9MYCO|nr:deoxyribose-phosphate aldolase [Mycolicibacterium confluentis]MCV7320408.1 deoxyribose-phosphate aldolase [Mycolicibacterium confluentis]ORV21870.1 2-deoxyribose-5-phosphate aldolase [Mycolicibacterium confluentis]BBZ35447.1 deoxyribose-phosphate aldolase [Mycolicibacterium confluentis]
MTEWTRSRVAGLVDHTLLKPEATADDVRALAAEAAELGVFAVCVSPPMVPTVALALSGASVAVATVAGFPSGKHAPEIKAHEAALAVEAGAVEVDMVIDIGAAIAREFDDVAADIAAVRAATPDAVLKVIVESAALLSLAGPEALSTVCRVAVDAGADFVKTSTGFHPSGGASVAAIEIMAEAVRSAGLGVKASGGIRTAADAIALLNAGATRLGLSGTRAVLDGLS